MKKINWREVDWNLSTQELATQLGVKVAVVNYNRINWRNKGSKSKAHLKKIESVGWEWCNQHIHKQTGVPYQTIIRLRKERNLPNGKKGRGKVPHRFDHTKLDWSKNDSDNAKAIGVSRERVRQLRKEAGLPSSKTLRQKEERNDTCLAVWTRIKRFLISAVNSCQNLGGVQAK